jgi:hypothetical protein
MPRFIDLSGLVFGKWTVLHRGTKDSSGQRWLCKCECGTRKSVIGDSLKKGLSKSCGCEGKKWCTTHGMEGTITYNTWAQMIQRCENPKHRSYKRYGGRGITVCKEWREDFRYFFSDMGQKPQKSSLGRIDNDGGYSPGNCRWEFGSEQARNTCRTTRVNFLGKNVSLNELCGFDRKKTKRARERIAMGWSVGEAVDLVNRTK